MSTRKSLSVVVACSKSDFGIGINNKLPWRIPEDMKHFKDLTTSSESPSKTNAVIMGRKTYESIPAKFRPLQNRINIVLTSTPHAFQQKLPQMEKDKLVVANSLKDAISKANADQLIDRVFVIGGESVYRQAFELAECDRVYLTTVSRRIGEIDGESSSSSEIECDTFCQIPADFQCVSSSEILMNREWTYQFQLLERQQKRNHEEHQYLDLIKQILDTGVRRNDRTGTGTLSIFGAQMRFSLENNVFPLLTTKRVFWRGVAEELLWFISGDTNAKTLKDKNISIWDGNGSKEYLASIGLGHREECDLGPVYGFQWRHFGAKYTNMKADYTGQGVDQLAEAINKIKNDPQNRRIIVSAWNPSDLKEMALPPCHMFCQFYVANGELSCQMYQRSADMGLGVPFNIASYSLLTRLVAQVCGLKAKEFIHVIGDAHVYLDHVEPLKKQLTREPKQFPKLIINPKKLDIDSFLYEDFTLEGYNPHKTIKMKMSV